MQQFLCGGRRFYPMSTWVPQGAVGSSQSTGHVSLLRGPEPKWTNDRRCSSVGWPTAPNWLGWVKGILFSPPQGVIKLCLHHVFALLLHQTVPYEAVGGWIN